MHADNLLLFRRHIPARSEKWIYNGWGNSLHFSTTSAPTEIYGKCKMAYTDTLEFFLTFVIITLKRTQCMAPRLRQEVYIHYFTDWFRVHDFPSSCRRHQGAERNFKWHFCVWNDNKYELIIDYVANWLALYRKWIQLLNVNSPEVCVNSTLLDCLFSLENSMRTTYPKHI